MESQQFWRSPELPFVESRCARDSTACYAPHTHPLLSIGAVDGGHSLFSRGTSGTRLERGDVVLIPADEVHACNPEADQAWCYQMLYVDTAWAHQVIGEAAQLDSVVLTQFPADVFPYQVHQALTALNRCLFSHDGILEKEAMLVRFIGDVLCPLKAVIAARESPLAPARLASVKALIDTRCTETLRLDELATHAGLSPYHFVRAFRREVGMTPHAWQLDARINRARQLLDDGMPLSELALHLGFADQSHFQRVFKQRVAVTPRQYQRRS